MELIVFAILLTILAATAIYVSARVTRQAMESSHDAWKHAYHAQDDCWQLMLQERKCYQRQIEMLVDNNNALTSRVVEASRQHLNVEVIKRDILNQVRAATMEVQLSETRYGDNGGTKHEAMVLPPA